VAKKHNFGQILIFRGSCTDPHLPTRAKFCAPQQTKVGYTLKCQISSRSVYSVPSGGEKPQFLPFFGLRHFVVSPVGGNLRKFNTGAQLQTFPYPMGIKIFSVI